MPHATTLMAKPLSVSCGGWHSFEISISLDQPRQRRPNTRHSGARLALTEIADVKLLAGANN
jgi:hypothetical protein